MDLNEIMHCKMVKASVSSSYRHSGCQAAAVVYAAGRPAGATPLHLRLPLLLLLRLPLRLPLCLRLLLRLLLALGALAL